jgi:hypothetical protein
MLEDQNPAQYLISLNNKSATPIAEDDVADG